MALTPKTATQFVTKKLRQFASRAWEATLATALLVSGLWDVISGSMSPMEVQHALAHDVYVVYGLYLIVSATLILVAIFNPCRLWARRVERTGMLLAGITMGTMAWLLEANEEIVSTPDFERVEHYFLYGLILLATASFARYWYLGKQSETEKIVHIVRTEMNTERRKRDRP